MEFTIELGSGLLSSGMPVGRNSTTSLEGWCDELGLRGAFKIAVGEAWVYYVW